MHSVYAYLPGVLAVTGQYMLELKDLICLGFRFLREANNWCLGQEES